ncbi:hypothetical protein MLD38_011256 [Melastoma candidum]|uniref:Uncharacterized protein n=1 Tax=Melastoma candidum TaxID=119954 RepID=A0ACB9R2G9_9MYRT|nr:hypothetical protein MLD38_011256 [Melastoma candidum]
MPAKRNPVKVTRASPAEFPALNSQGVSMAIFQFPPSSLNPPPCEYPDDRAPFCHLWDTQVEPGCRNERRRGGRLWEHKRGAVSIPSFAFSSGVHVNVLAKAFKASVPASQKIEAGLMSKT